MDAYECPAAYPFLAAVRLNNPTTNPDVLGLDIQRETGFLRVPLTTVLREAPEHFASGTGRFHMANFDPFFGHQWTTFTWHCTSLQSRGYTRRRCTQVAPAAAHS